MSTHIDTRMNTHQAALPVPLPLLVANVLGMAMIAAGIVAIQSPDILPALAARAVAWALIGAGVLIESGSTQGIVIALRDARGSRPAQGLARARSR